MVYLTHAHNVKLQLLSQNAHRCWGAEPSLPPLALSTAADLGTPAKHSYHIIRAHIASTSVNH
jgi:hypothetical protein